MFAPSLQKALSTEKLARDWVATTAKSVRFKEFATTRAWKKEGREYLVATARFEGGLIDVKTSYLDEDPGRRRSSISRPATRRPEP